MSKSSTSFTKGHVCTHDMAAAGRKSRKVSPWGRVPFNENALKTIRLEKIKRAARVVR